MMRRPQMWRLRIGVVLSALCCLRACRARARCPDLFRLWRCRAHPIVRWFDRYDMLNQAIGLLVHFCHELGVMLLVFASFACNATVGSQRLATFDGIGRCRARVKLLVVAFELLAFACWPRIIVRFRYE